MIELISAFFEAIGEVLLVIGASVSGKVPKRKGRSSTTSESGN
jgi:hypothetical protein